MVRTNRLPEDIEGLGQKTTVLTLGRSYFVKGIKTLPPYLVWMKLTQLGRDERHELASMPNVGRSVVVDWRWPDQLEVMRYVGAPPSSGLRMAYLLAKRSNPASVSLFGMSCWGRIGDGDEDSWWRDHRDRLHFADSSHDPDMEATALGRMGYRLLKNGWQTLTNGSTGDTTNRRL